jgi:hypothetical protein
MIHIMEHLHIGEKMVLFSLLGSILCFYPMLLRDQIPHNREHVVDALKNDTFAPYFLFSIAIIVPMMIEALFDLYFGVLPRKINTCRITLMSAIFAFSVLLYTKQHSEYNAEMFMCYIQARSSMASCAILSFTILEESLKRMKYYSMFFALLVTSTSLARITVLFYSNSYTILAYLFILLNIIFVCGTIFLIYTYRKWIIQKKNIMTPEETFAGISILIFILTTLGRIAVFGISFLTTGTIPTMPTLDMTYLKVIIMIELVGVLAILIVPGRIVGHYATANKVSSLPSISYSIVYLLHAYR